MHRSQFPAGNRFFGSLIRSGIGACLLLAVATAAGCISPYANGEPSGPQAAWVQRSRPISPAPVEYDRRESPAPPVLELQPGPVLDLSTGSATGPAIPDLLAPTPDSLPQTLVPPEPEARPFPPPAPAAETPPLPMPQSPTAECEELQAKVDELSAQVAALDLRTQEQAQALAAAQRDTAVSQQMTQQLLAEFVAWRVELDLVRETIRAQSAADLEALDELNSALEQVLTPTETPAAEPATPDESHMATQRRTGVTR